MAATQASANALKYIFAGTNGNVLTISAAQLIADAAAGSLKEFLIQANAGIAVPGAPAGWANLAQARQLSVYSTLTADSGTSGGSAFVAFSSSPSKSLTVTLVAAGGDSITVLVEIRFHPSSLQ
jgi:hypothetical protein